MTKTEQGELIIQKSSKILERLYTGEDVKSKFDQNFIELFVNKHNEFSTSQILDFFHQAQLTGADPRKNQVYLVGFKEKKGGQYTGKMNSSVQFSYHFLLDQASKTGELKGVTCETSLKKVFDPFKGEEKETLVAVAKIFREGNDEPTIFEAEWREFANLNAPLWKNKPHTMLKKCAIANALRWCFPEALGQIFIKEEMRDETKESQISNEEKAESIEADFSEVNSHGLDIEVKNVKTDNVMKDAVDNINEAAEEIGKATAETTTFKLQG